MKDELKVGDYIESLADFYSGPRRVPKGSVAEVVSVSEEVATVVFQYHDQPDVTLTVRQSLLRGIGGVADCGEEGSECPLTVRRAIQILSQLDPDKQLDASIFFPSSALSEFVARGREEEWVGTVSGIEDGPELDAVIVRVIAGQKVKR